MVYENKSLLINIILNQYILKSKTSSGTISGERLDNVFVLCLRIFLHFAGHIIKMYLPTY